MTHGNSEYKIKTREEMRERDPMLYEIITRYFPTDEWSPMDYAPEIYDDGGDEEGDHDHSYGRPRRLRLRLRRG